MSCISRCDVARGEIDQGALDEARPEKETPPTLRARGRGCRFSRRPCKREKEERAHLSSPTEMDAAGGTTPS